MVKKKSNPVGNLVIKKKANKDSWFKKRIVGDNWGFIPINWKGWTALIILIVLNVFAVNYFDVMNASFEDVSKFLVVFLLSIAVFILIAKRKTR